MRIRSHTFGHRLLPILILACPLIVGCCECGRPRFFHDGFSGRKSKPNEMTPEGFPREMIGYPQFAGEHDRQNRIAVFGHPNYHNEYPTPDYPLVPYSNRVNSATQW